MKTSSCLHDPEFFMPLGTFSLACHSPFFSETKVILLKPHQPQLLGEFSLAGYINLCFVPKGILRSLPQVSSPGLFLVLAFHSVSLVLENKTLLFPQTNSADRCVFPPKENKTSDSHTCIFLVPLGNPGFHGVWGFFPFFPGAAQLSYICCPQFFNHILLPSQPQISTYLHLILLFFWCHFSSSHLFLTFSSWVLHHHTSVFQSISPLPISASLYAVITATCSCGQLPQRPLLSSYYFYIQLCIQITSTASSIPSCLQLPASSCI